VLAARCRHFPFWSLKKRTSKKSCLLPADRKQNTFPEEKKDPKHSLLIRSVKRPGEA